MGEDPIRVQLDRIAALEEFVFGQAEHHPYWHIAYSALQILRTVISKWREDLTDDELEELKWHVDTIGSQLERLKGR